MGFQISLKLTPARFENGPNLTSVKFWNVKNFTSLRGQKKNPHWNLDFAQKKGPNFSAAFGGRIVFLHPWDFLTPKSCPCGNRKTSETYPRDIRKTSKTYTRVLRRAGKKKTHALAEFGSQKAPKPQKTRKFHFFPQNPAILGIASRKGVIFDRVTSAAALRCRGPGTT